MDKRPAKKLSWLKKQQLAHNCNIVNRLFNNLETRGGVVGGQAVLFVYDEKAPEMSYIITEQI